MEIWDRSTESMGADEPTYDGRETAIGAARRSGEAVAIARQLRQVVHGNAWHGPALLELLADVPADVAAERPLPQAHGIWELVLHVGGWMDVVMQRLDGNAVDEPPAGDFPAVPPPTSEAWSAARNRLHELHDALIARLMRLPDAALDARVPGRDCDARTMLRGVVNHVVYHSGQVALLKKALA